MALLLDLTIFGMIAVLCWRGYQQRQIWLSMPPYLLMRACHNRSAWLQLVIFGPITIIWLLSCHWINAHGWHATAAGGILLAMTMGLEAMRSVEERQKEKRAQ
ncbi:MAG: hypothetical protein Q9M26_00510 [Mariprofundales bacterium]|nr:hypothetical protein [Mariprofundales bacterium]